MSIRQIRLTTADTIREAIRRNQNKKVTLILENKTSVFAEILSFEGDHLIVMNGRHRKMKFALSDITELYLDEIV